MLDHLDTLDDTTPVEPDDATLASVHGRAARLRSRNRLILTGAIVIPLVIVAGIAALTGGKTRHVNVVTHPSPTQPSTRVAEGTLPNGLHVQMTVETPTVQLGGDIRAHVVVTNPTGKTKNTGVGNLQCRLGIGPVLRDPSGKGVADGIRNVFCIKPLGGIAAGGSASFTVTLGTEYVTLPKGHLRGTYELRLETGQGRIVDPVRVGSIGPVPVELVAPDVIAHLEIPTTTVHPGNVIPGHIVFDNLGPDLVTKSCATSPEELPAYDVFLSVDGFALEPGQVLPGTFPSGACRYGPVVLPHGMSRLPFSVAARYYDCSSAGNTPPDAPRCIDGHLTPPLAPRQYEIRFRGIGPLASVEVAPIPIEVVAAPAK